LNSKWNGIKHFSFSNCASSAQTISPIWSLCHVLLNRGPTVMTIGYNNKNSLHKKGKKVDYDGQMHSTIYRHGILEWMVPCIQIFWHQQGNNLNLLECNKYYYLLAINMHISNQT
jgi:hypothetical protein